MSDLPERPKPPELVTDAERLRAAFQKGSDDEMLAILRGGMLGTLVNALNNGSERTLTYAAPQIATLAERVGWVSRSA